MSINKSNEKKWKIVQRIGTIIAIMAAIATIIGLYLQYKEKKPNAEVKILSADLLTQQANDISGFSSKYTYNNMDIKNLWLYKLNFKNIGEATIITKGANQNTINNNIELKFKDGYRVLDVINIEEHDFKSKLLIKDSLTVEFEFSQWRPNEESTFSLLVVNDSVNEVPIPYFDERPLIDGDIAIINFINISSKNNKPIIDKVFNNVLSLIGRILSITLLGLLFALASYILILSIFESLKISIWKMRYLESFRKFIYSETLMEKSKEWESIVFKKKDLIEKRESFIKKPWKVEYKIWEHFDGQRLKMNDPLFTSQSNYFFAILISMISIFGCVAGVLAMIII